MKIRCIAVISFFLVAAASPQQAPKDVASSVGFIFGLEAREFISAADAMPEGKYGFRPTQGEFKDVRSFAEQVKHVAAANYMFGAGVLGEKKPPVDVGGENGPATMKSKAEIVKFLNDSFAYLHKALGSVTEKNQLDMIETEFGSKAPRLMLASFAVAHPFDHYGQMVEYLRMNGIVPPSSRPQQK